MVVDIIKHLTEIESLTQDLLRMESTMDINAIEDAIQKRDALIQSMGDLASYPPEHHATIESLVKNISQLNTDLIERIVQRRSSLATEFSTLRAANKSLNSYFSY